jgi:hypothetical protein
MTWNTCKDAVMHCFENSDGAFFLSLQADRYGYLPLPKYLSAQMVVNSLKSRENLENICDIQNTVQKWYLLDENHVPPRFELKELESVNDSEYWGQVLPLLRNCLFDSVAFEVCPALHDESLLINRSVTEWETLFGLNCDKDRCFWIQKCFDKDTMKANYQNFTDGITESDFTPGSPRSNNKSTALKLDVLKAKMKSYFATEHQCELRINAENYSNADCPGTYLKEWRTIVYALLEKELIKIKSKSEKWIQFSEEKFSIPVNHLKEVLHHCQTAYKKAETFFGREELLKKAHHMIMDHGKTKGHFSGITLALIGKSGCGKTAAMSKIALSMIHAHNGVDKKAGSRKEVSTLDSSNHVIVPVPIIIRFCGTSQYSLNGLRLIQSISIQILLIYQKKELLKELMIDLPCQDYKTAVEIFQNLISEHPVYLFLDSLDQLENRNEERSKLTFLRDCKPHPKSKIIVSSLPDDYEENEQPGKYFYQTEKTLKLHKVPTLEVKTINNIQDTIMKLLEVRHSKITSDQWLVVLSAVRDEPTILYINLAMEIISQWRSFDREVALKPTVNGIINQIFQVLETNYGTEFVSIAFSMITFSREGINDIEMKDLLSFHDKVLEEIFQYFTLHCFPMHVWLRLKHVIRNLVAEKDNHCIKWYHRQLGETATERYHDKQKECHLIMGKYFSNLIADSVRVRCEIHSQPLLLDEIVRKNESISIWLPQCVVNRRRSIEGYYHLIKGGLVDEVISEICSLEFVCASALCKDLFNVISLMAEFLTFCEKGNCLNEDKKRLAEHLFRWIRKKASAISANPRWNTRSTAGEEPNESEVRKMALQRSSPALEIHERSCWEQCHILTCSVRKHFDPLEMDMLGHSRSVVSVAFNHDGSRILSGSADKTIKIWDSKTGELLNTLEGHSSSVLSVSFNYDGTKIASGSADSTVKIWDTRTGELLRSLGELGGHLGPVHSVSFNRDGSKIVAGLTGQMIGIWDTKTGTLSMSCCHSGDIGSV